jgi:hypothetical protein
MQCATKLDFKDSDVNIFMDTSFGLPFENCTPYCEVCSYMNFLVSKAQKADTSAYLSSRLQGIETYEHIEGGKRFNFTILRRPLETRKQCTLLEYLRSTFDLSFCKVFYDGRKMHINKDAFSMRGKWEIGKHGHFSLSMIRGAYERMEKYRSRGFEVTNRIHSHELQGLIDKIQHLQFLTFQIPMDDFVRFAKEEETIRTTIYDFGETHDVFI